MGLGRIWPHMHDRKVNRILTVAPVLCSLVALAIVVGNLAKGVPPQADEDTAAHLFQFFMAVQVPLVIGFAAGTDWLRRTRPLMVIAVQALAIAVAIASLKWSGY